MTEKLPINLKKVYPNVDKEKKDNPGLFGYWSNVENHFTRTLNNYMNNNEHEYDWMVNDPENLPHIHRERAHQHRLHALRREHDYQTRVDFDFINVNLGNVFVNNVTT